jgi:glycosidase
MHIIRTLPTLAAIAAAGLLLMSADGPGTTPVQPATKAEIAKYLQVPSPDWRDQVVYFIMPDRFNDGNPANSDQKAGEFDPADGRKYSGGDLAGVTAKLDYIKGLGATAIWITPPVANQWWDSQVQYGGYHGYWGENFMAMDKHMGSLEDYQLLSASLHKNGMYLIQDIVPNHTGNFFRFEGAADPDNPTKGFSLNTKTVPVNKPSQKPFDQNDFTKKADRDKAVYHWTPSIVNFNSKTEMQQNQLSDLDDINTENPVVRTALRQSYNYWIKNAGVDGFRIDTIKYVPHDFWNDFHWSEEKAAPGVMKYAQSLGKKNFITFGEDWETNAPYVDKSDKTMANFLGTADTPELGSVLNFSLRDDLADVFAKGRPTDQLSFRFKSQYKNFPDPGLLFTFIDNHDMDRFATGADQTAVKQALLFLMTVPGVPVIYYGTEQGFTETRASMFAAGYGSGGKDHFDTQAPLYQFIKELAALRKAEKEFTRGKLQVLRDSSQAGVFAYSMTWQGRTAVVAFNTAGSRMLLDNALTGLPEGTVLQRLAGLNDDAAAVYRTGKDGLLNATLPPRSAVVLAASADVAAAVKKAAPLPASLPGAVPPISGPVAALPKDKDGVFTFADNQTIAGSLPAGLTNPRLILDGNLDSAVALAPAADGSFSLLLPVDHLGNGNHSAVVAATAADGSSWISPAWRFKIDLAYTTVVKYDDPVGDDRGPGGQYKYPKHYSFTNQNDIKAIELATAGQNLQVRVTMAGPISTAWGPPNGFDHVAFYLYIRLPGASGGATVLPNQDAATPAGFAWQRLAFFGGWNAMLFNDTGAGPKSYGMAVAPAGQIQVDKAKNQIVFTFTGPALGSPASLKGTAVYLTTWDYDGLESANRKLTVDGGDYIYGNGQPGQPLVMDDTPVLLVP